MAQAGSCDEFQVGTKAWTDCVHDSATGGGLMPWIVVIPLGVMVVGMMIGFARQFSAAGRQKAKEQGAAGVAGSWLIFVAFIELAIGAGSVVAAQRAPGEGGGYGVSATVLLGVGVLLFVAGVLAKARGRRRSRIYHHGIPGEAVIRDIRETGTMVNNQPMYEFDLDVTGSGFAPVTTTHREVVPFWMVSRIGPQSRVPVKVDQSNPSRLIFDWDRLRATSATQGQWSGAPSSGTGGLVAAGAQATPGDPVPPAAAGAGGQIGQSLMPDADSLAQAMEAAREFTGRQGTGWHVGKVIGLAILLFILAVVGGGLYFVTKVFGEVTSVTNDVTDQVVDAREQIDNALGGAGGGGGEPTKIEVARSAAGRGPVGYELSLPVSWLDLSASEQERQPPLMVDLVLKPQTPSEARIVVTRSLRFLEDPAPAGDDIRSVRREMLAEYGDSLAGSGPTRLAGEPAVRIDIAPGADGLKSRQLAVLRGGQVIFLSFTAQKDEFEAFLPAFEEVVKSWRWT